MRFSNETLLRMGEGYTEYRIPGIVEHKGEAVMCVEARANTGSDWGHIDIMIMGENGRRHLFVPKGTAAGEGETNALTEGMTLNNPTLISGGDALHLIFHVNYRDVMYTKSTDGGYTWDALTDITYAYREFDYDWNVSATGPGHGIMLKDGRLIAPVWLANGEVEGTDVENYRIRHYPSVAGAVYSDDGGATWHAGAMFRGFDEIIDCNETTCVEMKDGSLLFNIRHRGAQRCRVLGISLDRGESCYWMQPDLSLEDPMCFGSMAVKDGEIYFTNCRSMTGRVDLGVKKMNMGAWEGCGLIDKVGGYSDCAFVGGKLWVLYERTVPGKGIEEIVLAKEK